LYVFRHKPEPLFETYGISDPTIAGNEWKSAEQSQAKTMSASILGSFTFLVLFKHDPEVLYALRRIPLARERRIDNHRLPFLNPKDSFFDGVSNDIMFDVNSLLLSQPVATVDLLLPGSTSSPSTKSQDQ
jgi:hypothetical protein